jgi:hypothetical protein
MGHGARDSSRPATIKPAGKTPPTGAGNLIETALQN